MGISRHATARWTGDLKSGKGTLSTPQSGLLSDTAMRSAPASATRRAPIPKS